MVESQNVHERGGMTRPTWSPLRDNLLVANEGMCAWFQWRMAGIGRFPVVGNPQERYSAGTGRRGVYAKEQMPAEERACGKCATNSIERTVTQRRG